MSKVTVILTSYNHAKYLRESIESVLNQTYSDFELIIGDDASTDESWSIIQSYSDPRIHAYRHETHKGGEVINETVLSGKISGDYIAIHHSDDVWESQKLEKQVAFLDENPQIGAVFSHALIVGEQGNPLEDTSHYYYEIFDQPNRTRYEWLNYFFFHGNALCHPSVLIRKSCYDDCGLYRYGLTQLGDFDLWVRLCLKYEIHVLPEKLTQFRVRSNESNASGIRSDTRIRWHFEILQVFNNYRSIASSQEFVKVFPDAEKYLKPKGYDLDFALGMVALDSKMNQTTELFGLNILFEIINDPGRAKKIKELYDFTFNDFIGLTSKYDIFSVLLIPELRRQIFELGLQLTEQEAQILTLKTQLNEIIFSRLWRLALYMRRIRVFIMPPRSWRANLARRMFSLATFPFAVMRRIYNIRRGV